MPNELIRRTGPIDPADPRLDAQKGFLASRIPDGGVDLEELYLLSILDRKLTEVLVKEMIGDGLLELFDHQGRSRGQERETQASGKRDYGTFVFNLAELNEPVEIHEELRKEILFLFHNLDRLTYYEFLEVRPEADGDEIHRAFLRKSKIYHPDNFFRKNLGSYKSRVERIYERLFAVKRTLSDPEARREYDLKLHRLGRLDRRFVERYERLEEENRAKAEQRRQEALERNPFVERIRKAKQYFEAGKKDMEGDNFLSASNNFRLAMAYDQFNEVYPHMLEQVESKARFVKADRIFKQAIVAETYGEAQAADLFRQAADAYPESAEFNSRAARTLLGQDRPREAVGYARKAVALEQQNLDHRLTLGRVLLKLEMKEEARETFEYVLHKDKDNVEAKALLRETKKWFAL